MEVKICNIIANVILTLTWQNNNIIKIIIIWVIEEYAIEVYQDIFLLLLFAFF